MSRRSHTPVFSRVVVAAAALLVGTLIGTIRPADAANLLTGPTITSVTPNRATPGVNAQKLHLNGDFLNGAATVAFAPATGITIVGAPVTVSTTQIDVTVNVATDAPIVARDVIVTQQALLNDTSTCAKCVTVGPDITSVGGPLSNKGSSGTFVITGHAFKAGASVKIDRKDYGFGGTESDSITATGVVVSAPAAGNVTTITATVATLNRAPGRWKVTVVGADATTTTFGDGVTTGLQITGSEPLLGAITPSRINSSQSDVQFDITGDSFAQGLTAIVSGTGITQSAKTVITDGQHARIRLTSTSPGTGPRTLVLRNADGQSSTNTDAICANCDLPPPANPAITSVSPDTVGQGANNFKVTVTGANFGSLPVATVTPNYPTEANKKITIQATRDSSTKLTLSVTTGAATPAAAEDLTITFNGGTTATKANAFSVSTAFNVLSLSPAGAARGFNGTVQIHGTGFAATPAPTVAATPGTGVTFGAATVDSPSRLTVPVTIASDAPQSTRSVTVTQGASSDTCDNCFTVATPPTVASISPDSGNGGGSVAITAITGTNFAPDPAVTLEREGHNPITMGLVNRESATKISGSIDLTDAAPGVWAVRVTNADGGSATKANAFTVVSPKPTVTAAAPDSVTQATPSTTITITGTGFAPGMVVSLPNAAGITVTDTVRKSITSAEVKLATSDNAALGSRDLRVTNTDGQFGTCTSCFVVTQGAQAKAFGPGTTAYENFSGGAFVAAGSLDALPLNGNEFVTAPNAGGGPHIRPYRINPANGNIQELGSGFMAYSPQFTGGVHVAIGNIDGNAANGEEIITAAGPGGGPHVRVFHLNNDLTVNEPFGTGFMAYAPTFVGGVWIGAGDVNGDGKDEIITGAGAGGGPHVRVWTLAADGKSFNEIGGWMAYGTTYTGGAYVAAANFIPEASDAPVLDEVVTVPALGGGPHTRITNGVGVVRREFMAFGLPDDAGYRVTGGDFDFDTVDDIAVSRGSSSDIYLAQITGSGVVPLMTPNPTPFGSLPIGTNIAAVDVDGDGDEDLVLSPDHGAPVTIKLIRPLSAN